jgi:hypothetical protein
VQWFRIDGPVGELYDVGVVPGGDAADVAQLRLE